MADFFLFGLSNFAPRSCPSPAPTTSTPPGSCTAAFADLIPRTTFTPFAGTFAAVSTAPHVLHAPPPFPVLTLDKVRLAFRRGRPSAVTATSPATAAALLFPAPAASAAAPVAAAAPPAGALLARAHRGSRT